MDSLTVLPLGANEILVVWLDQFQPIVHVYRVNRHPFSITFINSVDIECQGKARSLWVAKVSETHVLILIQSTKTVESVWVKFGAISNDKNWRFTTLMEKKDFNCQDYLITYQERERILIIFDNFYVVMTEKLEHSQPITLNSKKVDFTTDIGTLNNLVDLAWESITSVSFSSSMKSLAIVTTSLISQLPSLYWIQMDVQQSKGKVLWRRSFFEKGAQAFFLESMPDKVSSHSLFELEDVVLVHNKTLISIMNSQGLIREYSSLELGKIVSMTIWEYKNNIITGLTVNEESEYFMFQIEPSLQYNLQIIQKYKLFPLIPHVVPFMPQKILVFSTLPSQNQSTTLFFTYHRDDGWQLLANEPALAEYDFVQLSRMAQLFPPIFTAKELHEHKEDQSRFAVRDFEEGSQIMKFKYGPKLFPQRICLLDIFNQFIPDLQISLVESIDVAKNKRKDQTDIKNAAYFFHLFSHSCNVSSILQASWTLDDGFYSIQHFELKSNKSQVMNIFQIKSSNYFLCIDAFKISLISASISSSSSSCEVVYEISLPEIIQALLLQGSNDEALSQALTSITVDSYRIDSSHSLNEESLLLNCGALLLTVTLNLSQILNKAGIIRRIFGRYFTTKRIHCIAVYYQDNFCLQIYHFDDGEIEIQSSRGAFTSCSAVTAIPLPRKRNFYPERRKAASMKVVPLNDDLGDFGLLLCFDDLQCCWMKLSINEQNKFTVETSLVHQFFLSGKGFVSRIIPCDSNTKVGFKRFLICFSEPQENWKSIIFHHSPVLRYEIDEVCVTPNVTRYPFIEGSSSVPLDIWNLCPTYLSQLRCFIWLESTIYRSLGPSVHCASYHLMQSNSLDDKKNNWITNSLLIPETIMSIRKVDKKGILIAIISDELKESFSLIIIDETSFRIIQSLSLTEDIHELFASDFIDLIDSMEISLYPSYPIFDMDHTIDGKGENRSLSIPIYFHIILTTPGIYESNGEEDHSHLFHILSFVFHEVNSLHEFTLLNYLYFPFTRNNLKSEDNCSLLPFTKRVSFQRQSHEQSTDCFILTQISNYDLLIIFSSGQIKIISWFGQPQIEELVIKSNQNTHRNAPIMIGAHAMKTETGSFTSVQRKVTTAMALNVVAEFCMIQTNLQQHFKNIMTVSSDERLIVLALDDKFVLNVFSIVFSEGGMSTSAVYMLETLGPVNLTFDVSSDQVFCFSGPRWEADLPSYDEYFKSDHRVFLVCLPSNYEIETLQFGDKDEKLQALLGIRIAAFNFYILNRDYLQRRVDSNSSKASNIFREGQFSYYGKDCQISIKRLNRYLESIHNKYSFEADSEAVYEFIRQEIISFLHSSNPSLCNSATNLSCNSYEEMKEAEFLRFIDYLSRQEDEYP